MNLCSAQSAHLYMLAQGLPGGGKKQVEMVKQVQPKGMSQHRFYYFLLEAAGSRSGRRGVRSQDLVDQRKIRGQMAPTLHMRKCP